VCAIFRDEARYLAEWVSFHRIQGVERFYLYDNRSTDDWRSELEPEIAAGIVEVSNWPFVPGQKSAYEDCLRRHRTDTRWIALLDIDEFLFSPTGRPLPEILRSFDMHPGVTVNWRTYGTSGFMHPPEGLVTENYLWRGPDDMHLNRHVKSIVYPRRALGSLSAHYFRLQGNPVGEDGRPVLALEGHGHGSRERTAELLRINHYYTRSEEEFRRKAASPEVNTGTINAARFARFPIPPDAIRDDIVLQFGPQLRKLLSSRAVQPAASTSSEARRRIPTRDSER
jgi:hypothetical protein